MLTGVRPGVLGVLGEDRQSCRGGFGCQRAVDLSEMVVHLDRAGLSGLVLDGVEDGSVGVEYLDGGQMIDGGQCCKIVGSSGFRVR